MPAHQATLDNGDEVPKDVAFTISRAIDEKISAPEEEWAEALSPSRGVHASLKR